jgi:hypothetical protein
MSDAVLYNALAWAITGSSQYAANVASWINTWFIANDTYMSPNLNYGQVVRGPGQTSRVGRSSGVIDLKCMVKVVNAVLVLRAGGAPGWTSAIDLGLVNWTKSYIKWLTSSQVALAAAVAPKCVTTFFKRQIAVTCFTDAQLQQSRIVLLQPACGAADPRERHCRRQLDNSKVLLYLVQETD